MRKIVVLFVGLFLSLYVMAAEPGNNLGKSLYQLQSEFPNLRYSKTEPKGDLYIDNSEDDLSIFFGSKMVKP